MDKVNSRQTGPVPVQLAPRQRGSQLELGRLSRQLGLTEDQRNGLRPILASEGQQIRALFLDKSLSADVRRQKLAEIQSTTRSQIGALLTSEQAKKLGSLGDWLLGRQTS